MEPSDLEPERYILVSAAFENLFFGDQMGTREK